MLLPEVLSVEEVILHVIDPPAKKATANRRLAGEARGLRLSERALPHAPGGPSVHDYFKGHIEKALAHTALRAAVFLSDDGAEVAKRAAVQQTLAALCADPSRLVGDSERLARRLHELVAGRDVISAGDLAVCVCRGRSGAGDWGRFVALLKIDSTIGFPQVESQKGGKTFYTVDLKGEAVEILPTTRQPVQKAAFVRPRGKSDHDLLLLDRQTSGLGETVAKFFAFDFLGAGV
ncbi:MAG TPA: nucleoid-associated protein, partial [Thermoanaerobaculia bacterium]|nr:nucleoid-associated protein [Thermoanaerobaculia bacterium]